jgi:hypothetical protein
MMYPPGLAAPCHHLIILQLPQQTVSEIVTRHPELFRRRPLCAVQNRENNQAVISHLIGSDIRSVCDDQFASSRLPPRTAEVGMPRDSVVVARLKKVYPVGCDPVNQPVFLRNSARPAAGEGIFERFGLADARKGIAGDGLDKLKNS